MTDIKVYEDVIERIEGKLRAMRRALKRERLMDGVSASRPHYHAVDVGARSMMADCTEIVALAAAGPRAGSLRCHGLLTRVSASTVTTATAGRTGRTRTTGTASAGTPKATTER